MHADVFDKGMVKRRGVANVTFVVHAMYSFYATSFRATVSVARLAFPRCFSRSYSSANVEL